MAWFRDFAEAEVNGRQVGPLSIAVLVDLELTDNAGGHVKCWQRIAEAVGPFDRHLDLTVYFLGDRENVVEVGGNARYVTLPPCLGTRRFGFLAQGGGHTDLAPHHPPLARLLHRHDVIHATDVFAFAQTGRRIARRHGKPLVASLHTDLAKFAEIYTGEIVHRCLGTGPLARFMLDAIGLGTRSAAGMQRKVDALLHGSDGVMVSNHQDWQRASRIVGAAHVSYLRRGIDRDRFNPGRRDRARLAARFGIPEDLPVLLFVGRIDATKKALFAATVARALVDQEHSLRFLAIGDGAERRDIMDLLGPIAVAPGQVSQDELGWIYPSADIFVFPSESEIAGNVVLEAMASGLPVVIADHPGSAQFVVRPGEAGIVVREPGIEAWRRAIERLIADAPARRAIGASARTAAETLAPSWREVVGNDLLPVWLAAAIREKSVDRSLHPASAVQWPAE